MDSQSLMAPFERRSRALILSFKAAILVAVSLLVGADLWWSYQHSLDLAEKRAANLSYMLAEYIHGSFALADAALRQLALHSRHIGGAAAAPGEWDAILASARVAMPAGATGSISVTDAAGIIRHATLRDRRILPEHAVVAPGSSDPGGFARREM